MLIFLTYKLKTKNGGNVMKLRNERKLRKFSRNILALALSVAIIGTGSGISTLAGSNDYEKNDKIELKTYANKKTKDEKEPTIVKELEDLRTANSSTYLLSNGSKRLEMYGADIRYEENGKFIDYDPSLKKLSDNEQTKLKKIVKNSKIIEQNDATKYEYVNTAGDSKVYFPTSLDENTGILMEKDDYVLYFSPVKEKSEDTLAVVETESVETVPFEIKENSVNGSNITYTAENDDVEYIYTSQQYGVKEEIVLNTEPETNVLEFEFVLRGLELKKLEGTKSIGITDKETNEMVAYIS